MFTQEAVRSRAGRVTALLALVGLAGAALAAAGVPKLRLGKDQRQELLAADREFDEVTSRDGAVGWTSFFADDGVMMPAGGAMVVGKEAVRAYAEKMFTPGFVLRWEPMEASTSSNLGYTYGIYKSTRVEAPGKHASSYGKYVTVWKKVNGRWKVAVDIGNASPAPAK